MNFNGAKTLYSIISTTVLLFYSAFSYADQPQATCYEFEITNSIENIFPVQKNIETWCYQKLFTSNKVFVYKADVKTVTPELSFLVDEDGTITHGSLLAGQISVHTVNGHQFNPFSVPMKEPIDKMPIINLNSLIDSAAITSNFLQLNSSSKRIRNFSITDVESLSAKASTVPWRGFWWPTRGMPMLRPLAKYDRFVQSQTGVNPRAASWENVNHAYHGVNWSGHCNGWAAASILRAEPRTQKTDAASGITFSISDQKGILSEADYCVSAAFFGNRNYGAGNNGDIVPQLFHKTLLYYIGELHKPVAMDYHSDPSVDNHVVSAYSMSMISNGNNSYTVTATLSMHGYDNSITEFTGVARPYTLIYKYVLLTDASGNITGGHWLSANPDFMWSPIGLKNCQKLDNEMIRRIQNL